MGHRGMRRVSLLLALTLLLALAACSKEKTSLQDAATQAAEKTPLDAALEEYRMQVERIDKWFSSDGVPLTGEFQYALIQMDPEDALPTLIGKAITEENMNPMKMLQYGSDTFILGGSSTEGAAENGWNASIGMAKDGVGMLYTEWYDGTGDVNIWRNVIEEGSLKAEHLWNGGRDEIPEEYQAFPIDWHDADDLRALDRWTPPERQNPQRSDGRALPCF